MQLRIQYWRKKRAMTLAALAKEVGVELAAIWKYEQGIVSPTVARLEAIATALDVTVPDLLPARTHVTEETLSV